MSRIGAEYAALNLPAPLWNEGLSERDGRPIWHRWAAIPSGTGIYGWDRWCRPNPGPYVVTDGESEPPKDARVCRKCRKPVPAWMGQPSMGDIIADLFVDSENMRGREEG
jgi:hypothetical protein